MPPSNNVVCISVQQQVGGAGRCPHVTAAVRSHSYLSREGRRDSLQDYRGKTLRNVPGAKLTGILQ